MSIWPQVLWILLEFVVKESQSIPNVILFPGYIAFGLGHEGVRGGGVYWLTVETGGLAFLGLNPDSTTY